MAERKLPNLPGSAEEDLKRNRYNSFFRKTSREFWKEAEIEHTELENLKDCDHYFFYTKSGVECKKCRMGLNGTLKIRKGKIYYKNQKLLD